MGKERGAEPSDVRHKRLESAEEESGKEYGAPLAAAQDDATHGGDREAVHGEGYGE